MKPLLKTLPKLYMPTENSLNVDTTFVDLSTEPLTVTQIVELKLHFHELRTTSKRYMRRVSIAMALVGLFIVLGMSTESYSSMMWIDWTLLSAILGCIGFLAWGLLDDRLFDQHPVSIRVDGLEYGRLIHESMRGRTSLLDFGRIDDIRIPKESTYPYRFIHAVLEKEHRNFIGLDRLMILNQIRG